MFKKLVASALFAGLAAGLIAILLQLAFVQPLLLEAELYESGEMVHFGEAKPHDHGSHDHSHDGAAEGDAFGLGRNGLSAVFSIFVYVGYALMLVAGFAMTEMRGATINARTGFMWGLAGFAAFQLAPSIGLPIEVPGSAAADLQGRQIWWFGTVIATAAGLWLLGYGKGWALYAAAAVLILLPHLIGAPHPDAYQGPTPPELASLFASRALAVALVGWAILGSLAGYFWEKENKI